MRFTTFLLKNLLRRKVRSLLTAFGVAVAVGTTVALLGISESFKSSTLQSFEMRGVDLVIIEEDVLDQLGSNIEQKSVETVRNMPEVAKAGPALVNLENVNIAGNLTPVFVQGWEPESYLLTHLKTKEGRLLKQGDGKVAIVGETLAKKLGKAPGEMLNISGEPFEIVGVFESLNFHENGGIVVPLDAYQKVQYREGFITGFSVVVDHELASQFDHSASDPLKQYDAQRLSDAKGDPAALELARQRAASHDGIRDSISRLVRYTAAKINDLKYEDGTPARLSAKPYADYANESLHLQMTKAMAWLTSTIAIVVGTIGMLNTMIMSVIERVREIATLRAIGWRKSRVMRMIVGESLLLSFAGAVIGVIGAILLTKWLTTLPAASGLVQGDIAPIVILEGFLMALLVGLIGGTYPAWRATRMHPSEGLRHE
jgi:putative ABC transport system permease protein